MPKVTVDYSVHFGVQVDTDTGEILWVEYSDDPLAAVPDGFFNASYGDEGNSDPEYLPEDHPAAKRAAEIVETITKVVTETRWEA